jgi:hypothetical protein
LFDVLMKMKIYPDLRNHFLSADFRDVPGHDSVVECVEHEDQAEVHPRAITKLTLNENKSESDIHFGLG